MNSSDDWFYSSILIFHDLFPKFNFCTACKSEDRDFAQYDKTPFSYPHLGMAFDDKLDVRMWYVLYSVDHHFEALCSDDIYCAPLGRMLMSMLTNPPKHSTLHPLELEQWEENGEHLILLLRELNFDQNLLRLIIIIQNRFLIVGCCNFCTSCKSEDGDFAFFDKMPFSYAHLCTTFVDKFDSGMCFLYRVDRHFEVVCSDGISCALLCRMLLSILTNPPKYSTLHPLKIEQWEENGENPVIKESGDHHIPILKQLNFNHYSIRLMRNRF